MSHITLNPKKTLWGKISLEFLEAEFKVVAIKNNPLLRNIQYTTGIEARYNNNNPYKKVQNKLGNYIHTAVY